jgi:hypothetical protein
MLEPPVAGGLIRDVFLVLRIKELGPD